ncbi:hypothetical protein [Streptomyces malaysiensis]|uniref:hypothetical protein n=1 Tax=Streptomyces malaysiensis TaxID=92644 RepID=UPI000BFD7F08|nr:hypothetical protein [Streptomyces malaysiensis]
MDTARNEALDEWLKAHAHSSNTFARDMNTAVERITGTLGTYDGRTVREWRAGRVGWPNAVTRAALTAVTGLDPIDLGFIPRGRTQPQEPREDPLRRRTFVASVPTAALTAAAPAAARPTVGTSDVQRFRRHLADLWEWDDQEGGGPDLERRALALATATDELQRTGCATSRVRSRLYALGATFTATAMWAAVDSRGLDRAQRHMERAITLAGLSGDGQVQHQIWRYASTLAGQQARWVDAVAASEAAMAASAHRRDPLYASLSHARLALALPGTGDHARAVRALGRAQAAYERADVSAWRPASMQFYTRGELDGLVGITHLRLGQADRAEYHLHRCIAALRPDQHRNRALYTMHVAFAQLDQREAEAACATAGSVIPPPGSTSAGRIPHLLTTFTNKLHSIAPDAAVTREWNARTVA